MNSKDYSKELKHCTFGDYLVELMDNRHRGVSVRALHIMTGISVSQIKKLRCDMVVHPKITDLVAIAKALDLFEEEIEGLFLRGFFGSFDTYLKVLDIIKDKSNEADISIIYKNLKSGIFFSERKRKNN